jgi:hypothetical protein
MDAPDGQGSRDIGSEDDSPHVAALAAQSGSATPPPVESFVCIELLMRTPNLFLSRKQDFLRMRIEGVSFPLLCRRIREQLQRLGNRGLEDKREAIDADFANFLQTSD